MRALGDTVGAAGHRECADRTYQNATNYLRGLFSRQLLYVASVAR
jgi:hypothetical protein